MVREFCNQTTPPWWITVVIQDLYSMRGKREFAPLRSVSCRWDGGYIVCGYFVSKIVDEGDVYRPLGAAGFTHHSGTFRPWEVLVAPPLLKGAYEYV